MPEKRKHIGAWEKKMLFARLYAEVYRANPDVFISDELREVLTSWT